MKKRITSLLKSTWVALLILTFTGLSAQDSNIRFENNWGDQGITIKTQDRSGLVINSSIKSYNISKTVVGTKSMQTITTGGVLLQNNEGAPNIPSYSNYIAIPQGATVTVKVIRKQVEQVDNILIAPAPVIPKDDDIGPLVFNMDEKIYSKNQFYPNEIVKVSSPSKIRGVDVVMVAVSPFQYNPVTKQMIVNRDIEIEITFEGGNGHFGEDRLRNRWWDPILHDAILNQSSIPEITGNNRSTKDVGYEYLIIVPDDPIFISWADSLKEFRIRQGITTNVLTTTEVGGNTVAAIEGYVNNAYNTWDIPPAAVLLMADYGTSGNTIISPIYNNYCVSDNIFADVDNDQMPDVIFARMTAQNEEHLETFVTKVLNYERNPPTSPDFYNHPITALGWQTERWFQVCSETVGGYFQNVHSKDPVRINAVYQGNPNSDPWSTATNTSTIIDYFGPNGLGYIPATPAELGGWNGGSASDVNNALNSGAFILQHRDHGGTTGWGEPNYGSNDINGLNNTDLSFIFSINCLTGKYNISGECFAEKFHRYKYNGNNSGALGLIAASEVSYSFVNDTYVWGLYDNMWPDFLPDYGTTPDSRDVLPAFGNAGGKYFLQQSSWPYNTSNKEVTYNLFHHHGDAFSVVYSEVPQSLTVVHEPGIIAGETSFQVTANAGSFIALTVNNEIIGTAVGTGSPVTISIAAQMPPNQILVTITKQNYYRYESFVDVIPPSGPYVIFNDLTIDDINGNGNGIMETGESIMATIAMKNIGVEEGVNITVTITTDDDYITITDGTEDYGNISAGSTSAMPNGFAWDVANNIPDLHDVMFNIETTDGTEIWTSTMSITGYAPSLAVGQITIDDVDQGNGNGSLDPGETVDIIVKTNNVGSYVAVNTIGTFASTSPFVTVNNSEFNLGDIESGSMETATFNITISEATPLATIVDFNYSAVSGEYDAVSSFSKPVGLIVEDWESGDMSQFDWETGGNIDWFVTTSDPYEGQYCNKSGAISHSQNSYLSVTYDVSADDSISFYAMVSSEPSYDYFRFYIDGVMRMNWSGEKSWQRVAIPVSEGTHIFKWEYTKDVSATSGEDCARLDYIIMPVPLVTSAYAGQDAEFCETDIMQCDGSATYCDSTCWTTSGTGTFNDVLISRPIYQPSSEDIDAGFVVLTFTGHGPTGTVSDNVTFTIGKTPIAYAGETAEMCSDVPYTIADAYAENYDSIEWTTLGDGTFDDAGTMNPIYTPGPTDIENGITSLVLTASGAESCGPMTDQLELTISAAPSAFAGVDVSICSMPYALSEASAENYNSLEWTTSGDGAFDDDTVLNPIYTPGPTDIENGNTLLTLTVVGAEVCGTITAQVELTISAAPTVNAGIDATVCSTQYTLTDAFAENYNSLEWTTSGDGAFDDNTVLNPIYTPGPTDIENGNILLTLTVVGAEVCGTVADQVELTIFETTTANAGVDADICPGLNYTLSDATASNYVAIEWSTSGDGTFDDTTSEHPVYTPGENDKFSKEVVLTLTAATGNDCPIVVDEMLLTLYCTGVDINNQGSISLYPNPNDGRFTLKLESISNEYVDIMIYSPIGKLVYNKSDVLPGENYRSLIDLDVLPGIYTIKIEGNTTNITKKIIIK